MSENIVAPDNSAPQSNVLIDAHNLYKSFGSQLVVDDISLKVTRGEVLGFLGPNGAGKSTTMRMLSGYLEPDSGTIEMAGHSMNTSPILGKKHLGYLPEGSPLYSDMTVHQFLVFIATARGMNKKEITGRLQWVVETLGLEPVECQSLDTLSKGYRRRVGLAQALIHDPDVLILDEPTDGLDPIQKNEVRALIRQLASTKAIIISTHILEEVEPLCTRVLIIASGKKLYDGLPEDLLASGKNTTTIHLTLKVPLDEQQVAQELNRIENVHQARVLKTSENSVEFELMTDQGADISHPVNTLCQTNGWILQRLAIREGQIDQVFRDLVSQVQPNKAA